MRSNRLNSNLALWLDWSAFCHCNEIEEARKKGYREKGLFWLTVWKFGHQIKWPIPGTSHKGAVSRAPRLDSHPPSKGSFSLRDATPGTQAPMHQH